MKDSSEKMYVNKWVFIISAGVLTLFSLWTLFDLETVQKFVKTLTLFGSTYFGPIWQLGLLIYFIVAIGLMISPYGSVRLGKLDKPEMSFFSWLSIILCTFLAGGGVFWSAAEPISHFLSVPPSYLGYENATTEAIGPAMSQAFLHWGFLAWSIVGTLGAITLMYAVYHKGMPLQPRSLLYFYLGKKGVMGPLGTAVDTMSIISVAAGTIGPIGFLALQLSFSLNFLFDIPETFVTQLLVIFGVTALYTLTAATPVYKGIAALSRANIWLTIFVLIIMVTIGPGLFIFDSFLSGLGSYFTNFFNLSLNRNDPEWLGAWTIFFWGWYIGYAPVMSILTARISRGRTVRELILGVAIMAPLLTNFWFSVLGGGTIFFELSNPGSISVPMAEYGYAAALLASISQLPLSWIMVPVTLVLVCLFLITTGAGITYSIAVSVTGKSNPPKWAVLFWGILIGVVSAALIAIGDGGIGALQASMIITAVPVTFFILPTIWSGPICAMRIKQEQDAALKQSTEEKTT